MKIEYIIKGLKIFVLAALALFAFGYVTMELWNWLMPEIFGLPTICWGQAIGLIILSKILFGSFGKGKKCCSGDHLKSKMKKHLGWKDKMKERLATMSDEDKAKMKNKCDSWLHKDDEGCC